MQTTRMIISVVIMGLLAGMAHAAPDVDDETIGRTPPRLSYLEDQVSFWRPGAEQWVQAQVNTALAPGDQLFVGAGRLELQIGAQAFVRAGADTQIGLETREPDFLRFKMTKGRAVFDLRSLAPGRTVEVATPQAAFTIEHDGYYRFEIGDDRTALITRRNGMAIAQPAAGDAVAVEPGEALVIQGDPDSTVAFEAAPQLDDFDDWNYARTDQLLQARSLSYVSPDTYGAGDLDRYGSWRTLPTYGAVWVPAGVAPDWAPYSTGSWMHDPYYGWTWVDAAPWGWAPYHYGRWVHVNGYWCWAPGPVIRRAVYAPALVAFLGRPGLSVGIRLGGPAVGWVSLAWGEPLVPWWGRPGFIHRPWWGGWGGPCIINSRVVHNRTFVRVDHINYYHNTRVRHAIVAVDRTHFGRGPVRRHHPERVRNDEWRPSHQAHLIRPSAGSYVPTSVRGSQPSQRDLQRPVVTTGDRRPRSLSISSGQSAAGFRSTTRRERSPSPDRLLRKSDAIRSPKADRRSSPAPARPAQAVGSAGHEERSAAKPSLRTRTASSPTSQQGRDGDSTVAPSRQLSSPIGPSRKILKGNVTEAPAAPARSERAKPTDRPRIGVGRPVQPPVERGNAVVRRLEKNRTAAWQRTQQSKVRAATPGPPPTVSPQTPPAGRSETPGQGGRFAPDRSGPERSAGQSSFRPARPSSDRGARSEPGYRPRFESRNGFQRHFKN